MPLLTSNDKDHFPERNFILSKKNTTQEIPYSYINDVNIQINFIVSEHPLFFKDELQKGYYIYTFAVFYGHRSMVT